MKKLNYSIIIALAILSTINLYSASPLMTLVEEVTSGNCGACAAQNPALYDYIKKNLDKIVPVIYHSGNGLDEPMYDHNPQMLGNRIWGTYVSGTLGTPAAWANGKKVALTQVQGEVIQNSKKESPISIYVLEKREGNLVTVTVIVHSDEAIIGDKRMFLVIVEDEIITPKPLRNGERVFPWVARNMIPGAHPNQGEKINLAPNQSKTFKYTFQMHPDWNPDKIWVAAFIQDYADQNKKVLQSARTMDNSKAKPQIQLSSNTIDFKRVDESKTMSLEIQNKGLADLIINEMTIVNDNDGVFRLVNANVNTIEPYQTVKIDIEFTPKANKNYSAVLKIKSNSATGALQDVQLYGVGFGVVPKPKILCETKNLDFGVSADSVLKTIEISNIGTAPLILQNINIEFDEEKVFSIDAKLPVNIEPSAKYNLKVWFKPKYNNIFGALMKITSNDASNPEISINLVGVGEGVKTYALLSTDLTTLDFGKVHSSKTLSISLTNTGYKTLDFEDFSITGEDAEFFSITGKKPTKLFNNDTQKVYIKFEPKQDRQFQAELVIKSNADNSPTLRIPMVGIGEGWASVYQRQSDENIEINISPNPANNYTNLIFKSNKTDGLNIKYEIFNPTGFKVKEGYFDCIAEGYATIQIQLNDLASGLYFIITNIGNSKVFTPLTIIK